MRFSWIPVALFALPLFIPSTASAQQPATATTPDGKRVAQAKGKQISILDSGSRRELIRIAAHRKDVTALTFSPDGKLLASADGDGVVNLIDGATGRLLRSLKTIAGANVVAFSPDGKDLVVRAPGVSRTYDLATGKEK